MTTQTRSLLPVIPVALVLVAVQLVCSVTGRDYYLTQLIMAAYYAVVVLGLCLVMGYTGQISLGHGAFFAIGGYTSAILTTRPLVGAGDADWVQALSRLGLVAAREDLYGNALVTFTPWAGFAVAMLLATLAALLIGAPSLRLKGHYLAMATLGFGLIVYRLLLGSEITGSSDGINGVPPWELLPGITISGRRAFRVENYYVACSFALLVLVLLLNMTQSRVGRALRSIHGGEAAANAMGVNTAGYKLKAFVISAVLAAAAGCLLTHYSGGIGPSEAGALKSVRYVALVAAGGMANLWGALIVSVILNFLSLRGMFGTYDHAFFGAMLIVIVSLTPDGPLKPLHQWLRRVRSQVRRRPEVREAV